MKCSAMLAAVAGPGAAALTFSVAFAAPVEVPSATADEGHATFALHCARCHGDQAEGGAGGPPLRSKVRSLSEDAFAAKVLQRYHWTLPAGASSEGGARDAFVEGVLRLREDDRAMPAWQSEPEVASAVHSLYLYLGSLPQR